MTELESVFVAVGITITTTTTAAVATSFLFSVMHVTNEEKKEPMLKIDREVYGEDILN